MITDRDMKILRFINIFGYSFINVMGQTFFSSDITARARLSKLFKSGFLNKKKTNLLSPRYAFYLSSESQYFLKQNSEKILTANVKESRIQHLMIEQTSYFYLSQIGTVERTTVANHYKELNHIPDMIYTDDKNRKFYIECEVSVKSKSNYDESLTKTLRDNPYAIIYVTETPSKAKTIAKAMPISEKLFFICIDDLKRNITRSEKISPKSQRSFFE